MIVQEQSAHRALPTPEDFPVTWEAPEDERLLWTLEAQHMPGQQLPLTFDIMGQRTTAGLSYAFTRLEMPIRGVEARLFNTYAYRARVPAKAPPREMAARGQRMERNLRSLALRLGEAWEREWLPEAAEHIDAMRRFDVATATMPELLAHLDDALDRVTRLWQISMFLSMGVYFAMSEFDDLYHDLFSADGAFDAYRLLGGFSNTSMEMGQALWRLSRRARAVPDVRRALESEAPSEVMAALEASDEGRVFIEQLRAYLARYGERSEGSMSCVSWIEDPTPVIGSLQSYVIQPDDADPALAAQTAARDREEAIAAARARLAGYPKPVVEEFETWLRAAQTGTVLSEDHAFHIDINVVYQGRRVVVEIGRRLAGAGVITSPDDIFLLGLAELREAMASFPKLDCRAIVDQRKAELERFRDVRPPKELGTPPPPSAAGRSKSGSSFAEKFQGVLPAEPAAPGTLSGTAGSPGSARGTARVIRSLAEAGRLRPGDVLVTETTTPPWTPLFATAAAVVTDTGGVLSHCAVVAREYGIPAVVGTGNATSTLLDGQLVEVDGDAGTVRVQPGPVQ
ncbi:MAG: PEP-utilizing enzyme [Egibacteraceae bacterium]